MDFWLRRRADWLVATVLVLGIAASMAVSATVTNHKADTRRDWLQENSELVAAETRNVVTRAIDGATAVAAFIETADVGQEEFSSFVAQLDPSLSLIGTAYVAIVPGPTLGAFIAEMQQSMPAYDVTDLSANGDVAPAPRSRDLYLPVQFFHPGLVLDSATAAEPESPLALGLGVDAAAQPAWLPGLERAVSEDSATVSEFVSVSFGETFVGNVFIVAVPVHDQRGNVVGLVAAPMVDFLLNPDLDSSIAKDIDWHVESIDAMHEIEGSYTAPLELPGTTWLIHVVPTPEAESNLAGLPTWLPMAVGSVLSVGAAGLVQLLVSRSRSRRRLEELSKIAVEKDRFLATISHEIRTPLTAVTAVANELRDRPSDFSPAEAEELLGLMVEQSDEVTAIVEDLLIAGRPAVDGVLISLVEMDLAVDVRRAALTVGVDVPIEGDETVVVSDPKRVRQIIRNLLTNALRYGGPNIGIRIGEHRGRAIVNVQDDGKPISPHQRERMFQPYTTNHDHNPSVGAVGLGLYISATLAELLGGSLTYEHDGTNSIFALVLPLTAARSAKEHAGAAANQADLP